MLIVSEFAGADPELRSGAIIVNPNDFAEVSQALYDAAHMDGRRQSAAACDYCARS